MSLPKKLLKRSLKKLDIFGQPTQIFSTSRNKQTNARRFESQHGSIMGGILTIIFAISTLWYLISEFDKMITGEYDNYNSSLETNSFEEEQEVYMKNQSFYPTIQIEADTWNIDKLKDYGVDIFDESSTHQGLLISEVL